jgi:tRNA(adenine34) deaminase
MSAMMRTSKVPLYPGFRHLEMHASDSELPDLLKTTDEFWMQRALQLAGQAEIVGEVPVGAVLIQGDQVLGEGWNRVIETSDPTAHAEVIALRAAGLVAGNYRLPGSTLYVTLEPCAMCAGALVHARVERLVFGAWDPRAGAAGSVFDIFGAPQLNHRVLVQAGLLEPVCAERLRGFFTAKRRRQRDDSGSAD